jgi:hypothetical protein
MKPVTVNISRWYNIEAEKKGRNLEADKPFGELLLPIRGQTDGADDQHLLDAGRCGREERSQFLISVTGSA